MGEAHRIVIDLFGCPGSLGACLGDRAAMHRPKAAVTDLTDKGLGEKKNVV
jgi:hypothetical protein